MIKYLGSKRRLVGVISAMACAGSESAPGATALDLFSGSARVGRALKAAGRSVTAVDSASYAKVLADTYVATDRRAVDGALLAAALDELARVEPRPGYVTEVFCRTARFFHPDNGARIDATRDAIEERFAGSPLHPVLLTSLLEAADRVDSTTGLQMAFLKQWAPRALRPLELRVPEMLPGPGRAVLGDACTQAAALGSFDVAYLDPPYNQHRYFGNYHVWETLVRWDAPAHYGVACKRADCRDDSTASPFNRRREMPDALRRVINEVDAGLVLVSHNDESWVTVAELRAMCEERAESVGVLALDQPRYVGARIGIHNPKGEKVGRVSHLRNTEVIVAAGDRARVAAALGAGLGVARASGIAASLHEGVSGLPQQEGVASLTGFRPT